MKHSIRLLCTLWMAGAMSCAGSEKVVRDGEGAVVKEGTPTSVEGMTDAVLEIEEALRSGDARAIHERHRRPYQLDPQDPFKRFLYAYSISDRNEAWQELTKITKLNDRFFWAYLGMAIILDGWKVDDQAEDAFRRALALGPKVALGHARFGRYYLRKGDGPAAIEHLQQAVDLDPRRLAFLHDLARAQALAGKLPEAVQSYRKLTEKDARSFAGFQELAAVLEKTGDREGAIQALQRAAELDEKAYLVRFDRARLLEESNKAEEALPVLQEACAAAPETLACWLKLAVLAQAQQKKETQVLAYERAVSLEPGLLEANRFLGPAYLETGEIEKAQIAYQAVLRKEAADPEALWGLARIFEQGEEYSRAIEFCERLLSVQPEHPGARELEKKLFARFSILDPPIEGKTPDQVFGRNQAHLLSVYKLRLKENPRLQGDILVKVRVSDEGTVDEAVFAQDSVGDPVLELCAVWNLKRSRFPKGLGATYDFALTLRPGG